MSANRTIAIVMVAALPLMLAGYMTGRAAPAADSDHQMKASFEVLQKKLPNLVAYWLNKESHGLIELKDVKTEIKLARFTGSSDAKIIFFISLTDEYRDLVIPRRVSVQLRYFDRQWTTTTMDGPSKWPEDFVSLMLAIDLAGDK